MPLENSFRYSATSLADTESLRSSSALDGTLEQQINNHFHHSSNTQQCGVDPKRPAVRLNFVEFGLFLKCEYPPADVLQRQQVHRIDGVRVIRMVEHVLHLGNDLANLRLEVLGNAFGHVLHVRLNVLRVAVVDANITNG